MSSFQENDPYIYIYCATSINNMKVLVHMQSCQRCVIYLLVCLCDVIACGGTHARNPPPPTHTHTQQNTWARRHTLPPVTFSLSLSLSLLVWSTYSRFESGQINSNTNMYIDMIVQCGCVYLRRLAATHTHTHTHTLTHRCTCSDWSHEIPQFIDFTLDCLLLHHFRPLCMLADPNVFSFCFISLTMICVVLLFSNTSCICSFCALIMFICFFWSPLSLSVLLLLWTFLPGNVGACYSAFKCLWPCIHRLCDSHSSAWHWGYV